MRSVQSTDIKMAIYSINDLELLTGIKKHTIRIWEQRYKLIAPSRTDTNIRYYTDEEHRHLFNISILNRNGYKISKLAKMSREEIAALVNGIPNISNSMNGQIDAMTLAMLNLDEIAFERIFNVQTAEIGFDSTLLELIYPLLEKMKTLWLTRSVSPIHEKFVVNLIRRKMHCAIDLLAAPERKPSQSSFFLYLPDDEAQELTLLYVYYLLRRSGIHSIYLGNGTNVTDLADACTTAKPTHIFTILDAPLPRQSVQTYVESVAKSAGDAQVLLTGAQVFMHEMRLPNNAVLVNGLPDMLALIERLKK
jgi:MerR family transcriptional regulator, light-induced transcriptional regulator